MTGFFCPIYEEELFYSWYARYLVYNGINNRNLVNKNIYKKNNCPDTLFLGNINEDTLQILGKIFSIKNIVYKHTMFSEYTLFRSETELTNLEEDVVYKFKRFKANINYKKILPNKLKYCPLCAEEDRKKYGETFWHTKHQLLNVNICPTHYCKLFTSNININKNTVLNAEITATNNIIIYETNFYVKNFAKYCLYIFSNSNLSVRYVKYNDKKILSFSKACLIHTYNINKKRKDRYEIVSEKTHLKYAKKIADEYRILKSKNQFNIRKLLLETKYNRKQFENGLLYVKEFLPIWDVYCIEDTFFLTTEHIFDIIRSKHTFERSKLW